MFKFSIYGILLLAGGTIALAGIFLAWFSFPPFSLTGWDIFSEGNGTYDYFFIPVILLVLSAMAMGAAVDDFIKRFASMRTMLRAIALIIGVLIAVLPIFLMSDIGGSGWTEYLAVGFYMTVAGGILITVSVVLSLLKVLPDPE